MRIEPGMIWIGWITLVTLVFYVAVGFRAAILRGRHGVIAPAMTGHPAFEAAVRVQANTLENMGPFLVALRLCANSA